MNKTLFAALALSFSSSVFAVEHLPLLQRESDDGFFALPDNYVVVCQIFEDKIVVSKGLKADHGIYTDITETPYQAKGIENLIEEAQKGEVVSLLSRLDFPTRAYTAYNAGEKIDLGSYYGGPGRTENNSEAAQLLRELLDKNCPEIVKINLDPVTTLPENLETIKPF